MEPYHHLMESCDCGYEFRLPSEHDDTPACPYTEQETTK